MSGIQRFKEKEAWEKTRELTKVIYTLSNDGHFSRINDEQFKSLYELGQSTGNMIDGLIRYPAKSGFKGVKYDEKCFWFAVSGFWLD